MTPSSRPARRHRITRLVTVALLSGLLAACTVGDAGPVDDGPADALPGPTVSDGGGTAGARRVDVDVDAPAGWTVWQVGALVFAAPADFDVSEAGVRDAAATLVPPTTPDGELLAAIEVYAEDAQLGPLEVRARLTEEVRTDQLGSGPLEPARPLEVPGSEGGTLLLWEYEQVVEPTGRTVPAVFGELDLLMGRGPQYSASISGATEVLTLADVEAIVASARVVDRAEG